MIQNLQGAKTNFKKKASSIGGMIGLGQLRAQNMHDSMKLNRSGRSI